MRQGHFGYTPVRCTFCYSISYLKDGHTEVVCSDCQNPIRLSDKSPSVRLARAIVRTARRKKKKKKAKSTIVITHVEKIDGVPVYYFSPEWISLRTATLKRDRNICQYCNGLAIQADHVIPRWKGGPDNLSNLVACCPECNAIAGGRHFKTFSAKKKWILKQRDV